MRIHLFSRLARFKPLTLFGLGLLLLGFASCKKENATSQQIPVKNQPSKSSYQPSTPEEKKLVENLGR